jgi:hypothetical protein
MADASDVVKSGILGPSGSGIITSGLEEQFNMLKNISTGGPSGGNGSALVNIAPDRLRAMRRQANESRPGMFRQSPSFYHPLFEAINLQLPTKNREISQWCFVPGTMVLMENGTEKKIEDVMIGDMVVTHLGRARRVVKCMSREYDGETYTVKVRGARRVLQMTPNHKLWAVKEENGTCKYWGNQEDKKQRCYPGANCGNGQCEKGEKFNGEFVRADNLGMFDSLTEPIMEISGHTPKWATPEMVRLLGLYAAEGNIIRCRGAVWGVNFTYNLDEAKTLAQETINTVKKVTGKTVKAYMYPKKNPNRIEIRVYSKKFANFIHPLVSGVATTKVLSPELMNLPVNLMLEFLLAFIDGDGHVVVKKGMNNGIVEIATASSAMASQVYEMCKMCRMAPYHYVSNSNGFKAGGEIHRLKIRSAHLEPLRGMTVAVAEKAKEKRTAKHFWDKWVVIPIDEISSVPYVGLVHNLEVEEDHSYVANSLAVSNCRHFRKTDGYVGALLDQHSEFPLTGMHVVCDDPKVKRFFEILFHDILKGPQLLEKINQEYWCLANVFPFGSWDDDKGIWTHFNLLNPDFVEVEKSSLVDEPILKLDPDDNLKRIVASRQPKELYEKLCKIENGELVNMISRGEKVPLNKFRVSHIAFKLSDYETVGTPIMFRAFKPLIQKDMIRRVQMAVYERHILPLKLIKVGSDQMPANPEAIKQVREAMEELSTDLSAWFVYHHAIQAEYVSSAGKIHPFDNENKWIREEIFAALMGNEAMVGSGGGGMSFATASIGMQIVINRYMRNQRVLANWVKDTIFRPVAIAQDFKRQSEWGEEYIVPDLEFDFMKLKDDAQMKGLMKEMMKTGLISKQTFYVYMGLDETREQKQIAREKAAEKADVMKGIAPKAPPPAPGAAGGMPPMGGGGGGGGGEIPGTEPPTPGTEMPASAMGPGESEGGQGPGPGGGPQEG